VWAVTTRRNEKGFPPFRVDDFPTKESAVTFIERIEPETPRISLGGKPPSKPLPYPDYLAALHTEGIPSSLQIYEMNKENRAGLLDTQSLAGGTDEKLPGKYTIAARFFPKNRAGWTKG
jgi:hypothetical protein